MGYPKTPEAREKARLAATNRHRLLAEAGLCVSCQQPRGEDGTRQLCRRCANRDSMGRNPRRREQRATERDKCLDCQQALPEAWTHRRCVECMAKRRDYENERNRKRAQISGQCMKCSKPALITTGVICATCYFKQVAIMSMYKYSLWPALKVLWEQQKGHCAYTGVPLQLGVDAALDHKYPCNRFPELRADLSNVQWVHKAVNDMKHTFTHEEFLTILSCLPCRLDQHPDPLAALRGISEARRREGMKQADARRKGKRRKPSS